MKTDHSRIVRIVPKPNKVKVVKISFYNCLGGFLNYLAVKRISDEAPTIFVKSIAGNLVYEWKLLSKKNQEDSKFFASIERWNIVKIKKIQQNIMQFKY